MKLIHPFKRRLSFNQFLLASLILATFQAISGQNNDTDFDLMLAGGAVKICSSMATKNCLENVHFENALSEIKYLIGTKSIKRLVDSEIFKNQSNDQKRNIHSTLLKIYKHTGQRPISKSVLTGLLKEFGGRDFVADLSDPVYYALFDYLEMPQVDAQLQRIKEQVSINHNANPKSTDIVSAFYQQAKKRAQIKNKTQPTILVMTSSSRDPFESADFYVALFQQFDAQVFWLPLDMTLRQAITLEQQGKHGCQNLELIRASNLIFSRETIYPNRVAQQQALCQRPELLTAMISQADGLFINGGDQSKTRAALVNDNHEATEVLNVLRQQVNSHQLVVGGTSAGTAVQAGGNYQGNAIAMISNGDSEVALRRGAFSDTAPSERCNADCTSSDVNGNDVTYQATGGLGLFDIGITDTHFSERNRELRLSVLTVQTDAPFAVGVDENTALLVAKGAEDYRFDVVGQNGVFVVENRDAHLQVGETLKATVHFINPGDTMRINKATRELAIEFAKPEPAMPVYDTGALQRDRLAKDCQFTTPLSFTNWGYNFSLVGRTDTQAQIANNGHCSYQNVVFEAKVQ